jgi:N-acetylmuramoyl-L-alanine amidase
LLVGIVLCSLLALQLPVAQVVHAAVSSRELGSKTLEPGVRGAETRALQRILIVLGYDPGPVDGIYGEQTAAAVAALQRAEKLYADGILGPATRRVIYRHEYRVDPGTTLSEVSHWYGVPVWWIVQANDLGNPNLIYAGQLIWVPIRQPLGNTEAGSTAGGVLNGQHIIIDPGHGGPNPGARGVNGLAEKDVVLEVGQHLAELLRSAGARVTMTRAGDTAPVVPGQPYLNQLQARTLVANRSGGDLFVSLHSNWYQDSSAAGLMAFAHPQASPAAWKLAWHLYEATAAASGMKCLDLQAANYHVLRETTMPAVLMELGFLSNWHDAQKLAHSQFRRSLARGLYQGVLRYHGVGR